MTKQELLIIYLNNLQLFGENRNSFVHENLIFDFIEKQKPFPTLPIFMIPLKCQYVSNQKIYDPNPFHPLAIKTHSMHLNTIAKLPLRTNNLSCATSCLSTAAHRH